MSVSHPFSFIFSPPAFPPRAASLVLSYLTKPPARVTSSRVSLRASVHTRMCVSHRDTWVLFNNSSIFFREVEAHFSAASHPRARTIIPSCRWDQQRKRRSVIARCRETLSGYVSLKRRQLYRHNFFQFFYLFYFFLIRFLEMTAGLTIRGRRKSGYHDYVTVSWLSSKLLTIILHLNRCPHLHL